MQAAVHPTGQLPVLFSAHCAPEVPTVLAGLIKVQQPDGIRPAVLLKVPNPRSAIAQKQNMPGPRQAAALRFPIQSPAQFQGCSLPTDDHFVGQQSPVARRSPPLLVPIKHPGLEFVPFHAGLPAFLLSPARSALAHHPAVHHQDGQRAGRPLRLRLGRDRGQAFLRLSFGQRSQALHQLMDRRVAHRLLDPAGGHLGGFLVGTRGRGRKAEFVGKTRRELLVRLQAPVSLQRTAPLAAEGLLPVINDEFDCSQLAVQRQRAAFALAEGEKPRRIDRQVVAGALAGVGVPIHGPGPRLPVRFRPSGVTVCGSVSSDDFSSMVGISSV